MSNTRSDDGVIGAFVAVFGGLGGLTIFSFNLIKIHTEVHHHWHIGTSPAEVQKADPVSPPKPQPPVQKPEPAPTGVAGGTGLKKSPAVAERKSPPTGEAIGRPVPPPQDAVAPPSPTRNLLVDHPASGTVTEADNQPKIAAAVPVPPITVEIAQPAPVREAVPAPYVLEFVFESVLASTPKPRQAVYPDHGHGYKEVRDRHPDGSVTWNYICPDCGKVLVRSATRLSLPNERDRRSVKLARRD